MKRISTTQPTTRRTAGKRVVLVAVGRLDRRATFAVQQARHVLAEEYRAVHVVTDADEADELELRWTELQPDGLPLDMIDDAGGIAATLAAEVRFRRVTDADEVVVLVGQLSMPGVGRELLHDHTASAVCEAVNRIPGAVGVAVPAPR